jgi:hypothetical protein
MSVRSRAGASFVRAPSLRGSTRRHDEPWLVRDNQLMSPSRRVIRICRAEAASTARRRSPQLNGPPQAIERVLARLAAPVERVFDRPTMPDEWLEALELREGEAVLRIRQGLAVCETDLAQAAFETLRAALPDTDIYISH